MEDMHADLKPVASEAIDGNKDELRALSDEIWRNPELCFKEYKAAEALTSFLEKKGFTVTRQYCGLDTAFKAEVTSSNSKEGGVHVCVICEYDALPEIGHACGHNLIAEAGVAAGLGLQAALKQGLAGHVTVMGTPAEEGGGGKVFMIQRGAFDGIDVAMMVHPTPNTVTNVTCLAISAIQITYRGKAAHAAAFPWEGINALDAAVMAYHSVSVARQQFKPTWRVHGIIKEGGVKPNIIPEKAVLEYYIRAPTKQELEVLTKKMKACFEAAATATGCTVEIEKAMEDYENIVTNPIIADAFTKNIKLLGVTDIEDSAPTGSTDMGNVTHVVPGIHPIYAIGSGEVNHSHGFTAAANTPDSHDKTLVMAKGMAHTCIDIMTSPDLMAQIKAKFEEEKDLK